VLLTAAAGVITLVFAVAPRSFGTPIAIAVPLVLFVTSALIHHLKPPARSPVWICVPLLGVALVVGLDVATHDASAAAQVFLCFPVLYAASQLRAVAASVVTAAAIAGLVVIVATVETFAASVTDIAYVGATLVTMTVLLVRGGRRHDRLVALLREQATVDPLTGLVTRRVLDEVARATLAERTWEPGTALIVLDVDRFKDINDTFGHPVGDDALVHVSRVLTSHTRPSSIVSRIGGDEIAVLIPDCTAATGHERAAELVAAVHDQPLLLDDGTVVRLSVSAGLAHAPRDGQDLRELYAAADAGLYRAKRDGRDQVGLAVTS